MPPWDEHPHSKCRDEINTSSRTVHLFYLGDYADRRLVGVYESRQAAEAELLRMALNDERPVAPSIEEQTVQS